MSLEGSPGRVRAQTEPLQPDPRRPSDAGHDAEPGARCTQEFIRWLADRLEHDSAFQSRIEIALRHIRVERALADLRRTARS